MADDPSEIMIPMLRSIRDDLSQVRHDIGDLKFRISKIEETQVHHTQRFDRFDERLARIENRLDLVEA